MRNINIAVKKPSNSERDKAYLEKNNTPQTRRRIRQNPKTISISSCAFYSSRFSKTIPNNMSSEKLLPVKATAWASLPKRLHLRDRTLSDQNHLIHHGKLMTGRTQPPSVIPPEIFSKSLMFSCFITDSLSCC